jgi:hypothetical protein
MKGISSEDFVKRIVSIPGVTRRNGHQLLYDGREIYVLQDSSGFPSDEKLTTAYGHWISYNGYKLADSLWVRNAGVPITDFGILLNDTDGIPGNFIENLGTGKDNSDMTTGKGYQCALVTKPGKLFRATINNQRGIDRLFAQFNSTVKK